MSALAAPLNPPSPNLRARVTARHDTTLAPANAHERPVAIQALFLLCHENPNLCNPQSAWHSAVEEKMELPSMEKKQKKVAPAVTRIAKPYTRANPAAQRPPTRTPPAALLLLCILPTLKACCTLHNLETPTAFEREGPPNGENETKRETTLLETPTALEREGPPNGENEIQRLTTL